MYSCAYFPREGASLEEAQLAKLDRICEQLRLGPDNHLLEIGTGWGGLGDPRRPRARLPGDDDDDLPRAARAGRAGGCARPASATGSRSCCEDYRDLRGTYDRLVSVEMIEAVGWQYFDDFFRRCDELLDPDGLMLLQAITIDDRPLRDREGGAQLRQHPRLPRRLPALASG